MAVGDAERRIGPIQGPRTMMLLVHELGFSGEVHPSVYPRFLRSSECGRESCAAYRTGPGSPAAQSNGRFGAHPVVNLGSSGESCGTTFACMLDKEG
jgi:hypothetical protein